MPDGDGGWWVVGSNFGQEKHPAWTGNLIADPNASVSFEHDETPVLSHLLTDDEKASSAPRPSTKDCIDRRRNLIRPPIPEARSLAIA